jgi:hypothetical protein
VISADSSRAGKFWMFIAEYNINSSNSQHHKYSYQGIK